MCNAFGTTYVVECSLCIHILCFFQPVPDAQMAMPIQLDDHVMRRENLGHNIHNHRSRGAGRGAVRPAPVF